MPQFEEATGLPSPDRFVMASSSTWSDIGAVDSPYLDHRVELPDNVLVSGT